MEKPRPSERGARVRDIPRDPDAIEAWLITGASLGLLDEKQVETGREQLAELRTQGQTGTAGTSKKGSKRRRITPSFTEGLFARGKVVDSLLRGLTDTVTNVVGEENKGSPVAKVVGWLQAKRETAPFFAQLHPGDREPREGTLNLAGSRLPISAVLSAHAQGFITAEEMAQVFQVTGPPTVQEVVLARENGVITVEIQREVFRLMERMSPGSTESGTEAVGRAPAVAKPAARKRKPLPPVPPGGMMEHRRRRLEGG
jgi:hypothetical protein